MKLPKQITKVVKMFEKQPAVVKLVIAFIFLYAVHYLFKEMRWSMGSSNYLEGFMDKKTFVFFKMNGCGHCKAMQPEWDKFKPSYKGDVVLKEMEASANKAEVAKFGVKGFPTLLLIQNDKIVKSYDGERTASAFEKFLA